MLQPSDPRTTPPGDWKYTEPSTGVTARSTALSTMLNMAKEHRAGVGLPTWGDWKEQVLDAMCRQNPQIPCHDLEHPERVWLPEDVERFLNTLGTLADSGASMVDEAEQMRRIEICKTCPKKGNIGCNWCGKIAEMITRFISGRSLPRVADVYKKSCLACGCDITSKTAYPLEVLQQVDSNLGNAPEYPSNCWMLENPVQP